MKACAKVILFGEHSVVYGYPAIALPVRQLFTEVKIIGQGIMSSYPMSVSEKQNLEAAIEKIKEFLGIEKEFGLEISSSIPVQKGLGSSASLSVAIVREISHRYGMRLSTQKLREASYLAEQVFHGKPSGIDNSVIAIEKPIYFQQGNIEILDLKEPIPFSLIDSGQQGSTRHAIENVAKCKSKDKIFEKMGQIASKGKDALEKADIKELGKLMSLNHEYLRQLGLSTPKIEKIIASLDSANGAKLAGSGLGGCVIALGNVRLDGFDCYEL